jgi:methylenetetrahydrofolate dehydrogenase (NADP+)/methenyltetrahydrofolate cyclohydrolase
MSKPNKSAIILDGKTLAEKIKLELIKEIAKLPTPPGLAAILVGDDSASKIYLRLKEQACHEVGINFHNYLCNNDCCPCVSEKDLLATVAFLNNDPTVNGIIIQLPLPKKFNAGKMIEAIDPQKDVDGFHPKNKTGIIPPTVAAVMELLKATGENLAEKNTLIIGKSDIFTKGLKEHLAAGLKIKKIKETKEITAETKKADIVIIALGKAKALKKDQIKPGAIIIDVGINKVKGKTVGDVDPKVAEVAGYLSPVPGGVGPLTVACLLKNVLALAQK